MHDILQQQRTYWYTVLCTAVVVAVLCGQGLRVSRADEAPARPLQSTMQQIFSALTRVFSFSQNEAHFQAPENQQTIRTALESLATQAAQIQRHGDGQSSRFDFLRGSLVRDAQDVLRRFAQQEYAAAQFLLEQLTENCFACHAKLPAPQRSFLGERFMASPEVAKLPMKNRARLAVATRQFSTALELFETMLQNPAVAASELDLMGAFEDYLKVSIRVQNDFVRPLITLHRFRQRRDVPPFLRQYLHDWLDALRGIEIPEPDSDIFARARRLIQEGQERNRFPADRRGLVHFVVASALLHRYLEGNIADPERVAEAYYLLGMTESYVSRSLWREETEFFLETAIRTAPTSPLAREAFAFLEDYVMTRYTGSSGLHIPAEVQQHLTELRQLLGR